jgi:hypothetical protein
MQILCHIVGITNMMKPKFIKQMEGMNYNIIDLDDISNHIFNSNTMNNMFKQYIIFKDSKNDKFKEIDKKMIFFWESTLESMVNEKLKDNMMNIIIGYNHNFKNINKRVEIKTNNKYIIKVTKRDVREIIVNNLEKHKKDIISGAYPLENIDFDTIYNNRMKIDISYEKIGYLSKTLEMIYAILELSKNKVKVDGFWIASTQPYNVNTMMHPKKNDKLFAFTDMMLALLSSFNYNNDEVEKMYDENNNLHIIPKKEGVLEKMNTKRYLYLVETKNFVPHEKGSNVKFFSQVPVMILQTVKINNVYKDYFAN